MYFWWGGGVAQQDTEFNKMSEGYKKQLNEVQLELLNNRQHMINTEAQVKYLFMAVAKKGIIYFPKEILYCIVLSSH